MASKPSRYLPAGFLNIGGAGERWASVARLKFLYLFIKVGILHRLFAYLVNAARIADTLLWPVWFFPDKNQYAG